MVHYIVLHYIMLDKHNLIDRPGGYYMRWLIGVIVSAFGACCVCVACIYAAFGSNYTAFHLWDLLLVKVKRAYIHTTTMR